MKKNVITLFLFALILLPAQDIEAAHKPDLPRTAGLTPESPVFFLDSFFEGVRLFFAFNPAVKARLHVDFAAERMAEIEAMIEKHGAGAEGIDIAQNLIMEHIRDADRIVQNKKTKGENIASLTEAISDTFDEKRADFKDNLKNRKSGLREEIKDLEDKINSNLQDSRFEEAEDLMRELKSSARTLHLLDLRIRSIVGEMKLSLKDIDRELPIEKQAANAISDAKERYNDLRDEADNKNLNLPSGTFMTLKYRSLISEAENNIPQSNFEEALSLAREANKSLDQLEAMIQKLKASREGRRVAKEDIREAEIELQKVKNKAESSGEELPREVENKFTRFLSQAQAELDADNLREARRLARQSKNILREESGFLSEEEVRNMMEQEARDIIREARLELDEIRLEAKSMGLDWNQVDLSSYEGLILRAEERLEEEKYKESIEFAEDALAELNVIEENMIVNRGDDTNSTSTSTNSE